MALFGYGIEFAMSEGQILHFWRIFIDRLNVPEYIKKPIGKCVLCLSYWVSLLYFISIGKGAISVIYSFSVLGLLLYMMRTERISD